MIILVIGLVLWIAAHLFKRVAPQARENMGDKAKGPIAIILLASIVLMVIGFRAWDSAQVWSPPSFFTHINNLLVLVSIYLFAADGMKTAITRRIRHPQLTAFGIWAIAHLLVNGDLASIVLFGTLLVWAFVAARLINASGATWTPATGPISMGKEFGAIVGAVILVGVIGYLHIWFDLTPFGG